MRWPKRARDNWKNVQHDLTKDWASASPMLALVLAIAPIGRSTKQTARPLLAKASAFLR